MRYNPKCYRIGKVRQNVIRGYSGAKDQASRDFNVAGWSYVDLRLCAILHLILACPNRGCQFHNTIHYWIFIFSYVTFEQDASPQRIEKVWSTVDSWHTVAQAATAVSSGASFKMDSSFRRIMLVSAEVSLALSLSARHSARKSVNICVLA